MASALEAKGYKVICNKLGANMAWNIMGKTDENAYLLDMGWREMLDPLDPSKTIIYKGTKPEEYKDVVKAIFPNSIAAKDKRAVELVFED